MAAPDPRNDDSAAPRSLGRRLGLLRGRAAASASAPSSTGSSAVSATLLRDAGRRLGLMSLLLGIGCVVSLAVFYFAAYVVHYRDPGDLKVVRITMASLLVISIGVFVLSRNRRIDPKRLLDIGLGYEILGAFGFSLMAFFNAEDWPTGMTRVPWLGMWIVLYPIIVPCELKKSIMATIASALTLPLGLGVLLASGAPAPPTNTIFFLSMSIGLTVILAIAPTYIVHTLSTSLSSAERKLRRFGSYQLVERLGSGGMGEVWRAEHALLARPAAIKVIRPDRIRIAASANVRFVREAKTTAALRCPHTVDLYDYGVTEDGALFYVMELLEGVDLERLVEREGPLPPERVVHIIRQTCESLAEAHDAGLVHRDVKPANIQVCRIGLEWDYVKVLDFGLVTETHGREESGANAVATARAESEPPTSDPGDRPLNPRLTEDGAFVGTSAYASPEVAGGRRRVDGRADLYSLGCVAFWLLTGELVFDAPDTVGALVAHLHREPDPPSRRAPRPIPEALDEIVLACLRKSPADRPANALELARLLDGLTLRDPWTQERARTWWEARGRQTASGRRFVQSGALTTTAGFGERETVPD